MASFNYIISITINQARDASPNAGQSLFIVVVRECPERVGAMAKDEPWFERGTGLKFPLMVGVTCTDTDSRAIRSTIYAPPPINQG